MSLPLIESPELRESISGNRWHRPPCPTWNPSGCGAVMRENPAGKAAGACLDGQNAAGMRSRDPCAIPDPSRTAGVDPEDPKGAKTRDGQGAKEPKAGICLKSRKQSPGRSLGAEKMRDLCLRMRRGALEAPGCPGSQPHSRILWESFPSPGSSPIPEPPAGIFPLFLGIWVSFSSLLIPITTK